MDLATWLTLNHVQLAIQLPLLDYDTYRFVVRFNFDAIADFDLSVLLRSSSIEKHH